MSKTSSEIIEEFANTPEVKIYYELEKRRLQIATRIKQIRLAQNLSQLELGQKMGVQQSFIAGVEKGKRKPTLETLNKFCIATGTKITID